MKINRHDVVRWMIPLIGIIGGLLLKTYASDTTNFIIGGLIVIVATVMLIPQVRWPANYDPLKHFDWQIYTKPRPNIAIALLILFAYAIALVLMWNQAIKLQ